MQAEISGNAMPVLQLTFGPGEQIISEPGQFSWMSANVELQTKMGAGGSKGIFGAIGRALSGGGLFLNTYEVRSGEGMVAFASKMPGQIVQVELDPQSGYMVHRHGFLCGTRDVELAIGFQRSLGAGIFGGEGFIMQKLGGSGSAWVELGGDVVSYDLAPGESLRVHPGHVGMFEAGVGFDMTLMKGIKNALFGGDGLFVANLSGPGKVWLQSLAVPNIAHAIIPYLPEPKK